MNRTILTLLFSAACLAVGAITPDKAVSTKISGIAQGTTAEYYLLRYRDQLDTLHLDAAGNYSINIMLDLPEECKILFGRNQIRLYVLPGDELTCVFDAEKNATPPVFTGKSSAYCAALAEVQKNEQKYQRSVHPKAINPVSPKRAVAVEDSIGNLRNQWVREYATANQLNAEFIAYMTEALKYLGLQELASYRRNSTNYQADSLKGEIAAFDAYMLSMPVDNPRMVYNDYYQQYVRSLIAGNAQLAMVFDSPEDYPEYYNRQMDETLRLLKTEPVRNYLLKELAVEAMRETGTRDISDFMNRFEANCTQPEMRSRVMRIWSTYASIQPGASCPKIECYDSNGQTMLISDLAGKVVYIDIWATWCGPCKREIPMLKELEASYHGKDVAFVSISTDKDVEAWKKFIVDQSLTGIQVHQSDNFDLTISKNFIVNSIPRFILLDKEGKIISSDAPRPSSGDVIKGMIDAALASR